MFYYNITYTIEKSLFEQWKKWLSEILIPETLCQERFSAAKLIKVIVDDPEYDTYSLQLETDTLQVVKDFQASEPRFRHLLYRQFSERVLSFSSELHLVETISNADKI